MFQDVIGSYAAITIKFVASGENNGHDCWSYCNGKVEPLCLHLCLVASHCDYLLRGGHSALRRIRHGCANSDLVNFDRCYCYERSLYRSYNIIITTAATAG